MANTRAGAQRWRSRAGKEGGYGFFSGRDASRAYITGKFEEDLNDDVEDFQDDSMAALLHWRGFYFEVRLRCASALRDITDHLAEGATCPSMIQNKSAQESVSTCALNAALPGGRHRVAHGARTMTHVVEGLPHVAHMPRAH